MQTMDDGPANHFVNAFSATLNQYERQLLMLFYAEELTPGEIALVLDRSEPTVRKELDHIRDRAQEALAATAS